MKKKTIVIGIMTFVLITAWNIWQFSDWRNMNSPRSNGETVEKPEPTLWLDIKKTSMDKTPDGGFEPKFDESVTAADGTRVKLPGVGFLLNSGVRKNDKGENEVTEFLLLPGNGGVAWCCGLTPIPNFEFSVLVECPDTPFLTSKAAPKSSAVFVSVEGILRLQKKNSIDTLYTLEDVLIEFIDMKDVLPPNVRNLCLDQPMIP